MLQHVCCMTTRHAFVEFSDEAGAIAAVALNGTKFKGRALKVSRKK